MHPSTAKQLLQLTNQFYETIADSFSVTRQRPWASFTALEKYFAHDSIPTVLDLGCGNGRLALTLHEFASDFYYTGIDGNTKLLTDARERLGKILAPAHLQLIHHDFLTKLLENKPLNLPPNHFSHVCVFGVFHHMPTATMRKQLLQELIASTQAGGFIFISFWQPLTQNERFAKKALSPDKFNIPTQDLEPNDLLLGWQDRVDVARYCHSFTKAEILALLDTLVGKVRVVENFRADGKTNDLNQHVVLQKT